jgi:hypothetical protein
MLTVKRAAADGNSAQCPFGGIVGQADPPVIEKPGKGSPALQHVVDGLGGVGVARQPGALGPHPAFQCGNQRLDPLLSDGMPVLGRGAVDLALDGEDLVDAATY